MKLRSVDECTRTVQKVMIKVLYRKKYLFNLPNLQILFRNNPLDLNKLCSPILLLFKPP